MQETLEQLKTYWEAVWRRKWLIILPVLLCTAASVYIALKLPSYYRSTTIILVEQQQIPEEYVTPTNRTPFGQRLHTIRQQIMSRPNMEKIINDFHLYPNSGGGGMVALLKKKLGMKVSDAPLKETSLERMSKDIEVNIIGGQRGDAFSISYTGTDPYTVMQVTSTLASLFIEGNLKVREQYAEGTSEFLSNELESAKKELESQERAVRNFKEKFMGGLPQQLETNLRTLDRLQMERQNVRVDIKNAEDRRILLESQLRQTTPSAPGSSDITGAVMDPLAVELARLQQELSILLSTYKETYPDVITTRRRINEIKDRMMARPKEGAKDKKPDDLAEIAPEIRNPAVHNNLMTVKTQITSLKHREEEIAKQIDFFEKRVEETPAIEQKFADLRRDYDISLRNYQALLEKKLNAKLYENLEKRQKGERFTIIDPANLPERPFKPNRPVVALLGPMAGLGIGVGFIFILEFLHPAFRRAEDFEGVLAIPVLVSIPEFPELKAHRTKKGG